MKNLLATITTYKAKKAEADKLMKEADKIKAELIGYMKEKETTSIVIGQYTLTITECTKTSIDEKLLRERYPDIAQEAEKVTTYERFTAK